MAIGTLTVMSGHANLSTTHAWCPVWAFLMAKALNGFGPAWLHFNDAYCEQLEALHDPAWSIPLPTPLPTKLDDLRNHQLLMEDIWISLAIGKIPPCRWVEDQDVRDGIRAMLKRDRCLEEQRQLGVEADNLYWWYGNELAAIELMLRTPESECLSSLCLIFN